MTGNERQSIQERDAAFASCLSFSFSLIRDQISFPSLTVTDDSTRDARNRDARKRDARKERMHSLDVRLTRGRSGRRQEGRKKRTKIYSALDLGLCWNQSGKN